MPLPPFLNGPPVHVPLHHPRPALANHHRRLGSFLVARSPRTRGTRRTPQNRRPNAACRRWNGVTLFDTHPAASIANSTILDNSVHLYINRVVPATSGIDANDPMANPR